jgi:hypothetical protein
MSNQVNPAARVEHDDRRGGSLSLIAGRALFERMIAG